MVKRRAAPVARNLVTPPVPRLVGQAVAAAYLGISERMFETYWRKYEMPYPIRLGRRLLWDLKILDEWVDVLSDLDKKPNFFGD